MNKIMLFDEYEVKARYIPTFISVIPIVHFLILFLGEAFWKELSGNIGWMLIITNLSLAIIVMLALVQVQCSFAKHWIEESIFGKGGERFPTTDMLLYSGKLISLRRKDQIRDRINKVFGFTLSTKSEENNNLANARLQAREVVGHVRTAIGKDGTTFQYNIRYGFFRNLIGGVVWSTIGSICCSIYYGVGNNWKPMSFFIVFFLIYFIMFLVRKKILQKVAYTYADALFTEYLNLHIGGNNG